MHQDKKIILCKMARARGNTCHETPVAQNFFASLAHKHRVTKPCYWPCLSDNTNTFPLSYRRIVLLYCLIYVWVCIFTVVIETLRFNIVFEIKAINFRSQNESTIHR